MICKLSNRQKTISAQFRKDKFTKDCNMNSNFRQVNVDSKDSNLLVNLRDDVEWLTVLPFEVLVHMLHIVLVKGAVVSFSGVLLH